MKLDFGTDLGKRAARRLREETVIWLTTVGANGTPQTRPVWFLWDGGSSVLIYTRPEGRKVTHLATAPRVSLNFDSDGAGGNIVVFTGSAAVDPAAPSPQANGDYVAKYAEDIRGIGMDAESFANAYSTAIRVRLESVRGH